MTVFRPRRTARCTAAALAFSLLAAPAVADGDYVGFDISETTTGGVLSASRGKYTFVATVTDYGDGVSAGLSFSRRLPYNLGIPNLTLSVGPAIGFGGGDLSEVKLGVVASAQRYTATDWGSHFMQASIGSINQSFFLQAQATLAEPGLTFGISRGGSTEYDEASISISKKLGDSPASLRAGYLLMGKRFFVGFSINTF